MTTFHDLYPLGAVAVPMHEGSAVHPDHAIVGPLAKGTKSTPVYLAHSYPTKVPPEAIQSFLETFTRPGDVICDPFCGSGMTGVASRRLGRHAFLSDLSPLAVHLSTNVTSACDPTQLRSAADAVLASCSQRLRAWYSSRCVRCQGPARLEWLVWGDTLACPECATPVRLWDEGFDAVAGVMRGRTLSCPRCQCSFARHLSSVVESAPVWASVTCLRGCPRTERPPLHVDAVCAAAVAAEPLVNWAPCDLLDVNREMYRRQSLARHGVVRVSDFYTPRNLRALACLWAAIMDCGDPRIRQALAFAFTNTAWHGTRMRRFNARGGQRPLTGTLYIPQMSVEVNVAAVFAHKIDQLVRFFSTEPASSSVVDVRLASATDLGHIPTRSVDYVFTDPPFGSNIFYADCAVIAESWLGQLTDTEGEAVVNRSLPTRLGGKTVVDYRDLMSSAFAEVGRILKSDATATIVFQNTDPAVWQALDDALAAAGLSSVHIATLDKSQESHKGYKGRSGAEDVASFDIVLTLRHRAAHRGATPRKKPAADAVSVLRAHLEGLPLPGTSREADRQRTLPYLYSVLLRAHFNGDVGLEQRGYACVRDLCQSAFLVDEAGRWLIGTAAMVGDEGQAESHNCAVALNGTATRN